MGLDPVARALAAAETARQKRLRILTTLRASMGRAALQPLELAATRPVIGANLAASAITTGTTWQVSDDSGVLHAGKYSFVGAHWKNPGSSYPNTQYYRGVPAHRGDGSDPAVDPVGGGRVRFALDAPSFELYVRCDPVGTNGGFRIKVDGKYARAGTMGTDASNGALRFIPVTWGDGSATQRKTRFYELEFIQNAAFCGIRTTALYRPAPWPQPDGLRVLVHGDSLVDTVADSGNRDASLTASNGYLLGDLLGQADTWASGTGGAGWFAPAAHTQSWFNDRVRHDVVAHAPDVIVELGGANDAGVGIDAAAMQAAVEAWLAAVLAAKPETVVFMTGPLATGNPSESHRMIGAAKAAAAARYPRNVAYIDNLADPWFFGTGRQGAAIGDGNRDWAIGPDGAHPTLEGHRYLARRIASGIAAAVPALIARQG